MPKGHNYTWDLRLGTKLVVTRTIGMQELENLMGQPEKHQEEVKQGLKAYMSGAFAKALIEQRDRMVRDIEDEFDKQWDEMVQAHNKKVGRT